MIEGPPGGAAEVLVLGPVAVRRGREAVAPPGVTSRALVGALGLAGSDGLPLDLLAELLWADRAADMGRSAFDVAVHRARGWLRRVAGDGARIDRAGKRCVLVSSGESDAQRFRRLVSSADRLTGAARADALAVALSLWRGEPLADVPTRDAVAPEITRLAQMRRAAVLRHGRVLLELGRMDEAVATVRALADHEPLDEALQAVLIESLAAAGRQAEALRRFEVVRTRLAGELGADAGIELNTALLRVLRQEVDEPAREPRPPRMPLQVPAQLPPDQAGFTGRDEQLAALDALLDRGPGSPVPVAVLSGIGGVGKTALAVHWARRVAHLFPDGQLHIDLRGYAPAEPVSAAEALARFLRGLGVPAARIPSDVDDAAVLFRTLLTDRRMLVLLDNARTAEQVRPLLPAARGSLVLVTSRDRLDSLVARDGADRLELDMLTQQESLALLADIVGAKRIEAEPAAAAELTWLCGRLPLALRIVAAGLAAEPGRIRDKVALLRADQLAGLSVTGDAVLSVRAVFDLSYQLLSTSDRRLFRLLGCLPGPDVTVPAAAALAATGEAEVHRCLDRLVAAHLVRQNGNRYSLHDLLVDYARDRSHTEDPARTRDTALSRFCHWYLRSAHAAVSARWPNAARLPLPGSPAPVVAVSDPVGWLETELPNLVAVVEYAATRDYRDVSWRLADALQILFTCRYDHVSRLAVNRAALVAAADGPNRLGLAVAHVCLALAYRSAGAHALAGEHVTLGLEASRRAGWACGEALALNEMAQTSLHSGNPVHAIELFHRSIERSPTADLRLVGRANLGLAYRAHGDLAAAVDCTVAALVDCRRGGDASRELDLLADLGEHYWELGWTTEARTVLADAIEVAGAGGDPPADAKVTELQIRLNLGSNRARRLAAAVWERTSTTGDPRHRCETALLLGDLDVHAGDYPAAADWYRLAARVARAGSELPHEARALIGLARAHHGLRRPDRAIGHARGGLSLAVNGQYRLIEADALSTLASIYLTQGNTELACSHAERALARSRECGARPRMAEAHATLRARISIS